VLDDQRFEFLGDVFLAFALASPGECDDLHYVFLIAIRMQTCPSVSTCSIFQNNLRIAVRTSLNYPSVAIHCNLHIAMRTSLSCPSSAIRHNLRIVTCSSLSCSLVGICWNLRITAHNSLTCLSANICCNLCIATCSFLSYSPQFVHHCAHLSELPVNWHLSHAAPQME
jgi:hypothetical protein